MSEFIRVSEMPARLADADAGPLWIRAAYEPDRAGEARVSRPVASAVPDAANPGEWFVTYANEFPRCRKTVRMAGERMCTTVDVHTLESPDGTLVAVLPVDAGCQWGVACAGVAVTVLPHPNGAGVVGACERCAVRFA